MRRQKDGVAYLGRKPSYTRQQFSLLNLNRITYVNYQISYKNADDGVLKRVYVRYTLYVLL
jgi:hypothetical protein